MKTAVIVIDMINDFVTGKLGFKGAVEIIPNIRELLAAARAKVIPVIYVCDSHTPEDPEVESLGEHAMAGSEGSKVSPELKPKKGELVLPKRTYDIFFGTELDGSLKKIGTQQLVLVGVLTDICVQHSAAGSFFRGYKVLIPEDCVASPYVRNHKYALNFMKKFYAAKITSSKDLMEGWGK